MRSLIRFILLVLPLVAAAQSLPFSFPNADKSFVRTSAEFSVTPTPPVGPVQVLSSNQRAAIDTYTDAAPTSITQSVAALAAYLSGVGPDDLSRARALYRWVTKNINYDVEGLRSGKPGNQNPDAVLQRRLAVCEGYVRLGESIGRAMGLDILGINGWSKGYGYTPGQRFSGPADHAWNSVRVDGQWRLMDLTWGAGIIDQQMHFVRAFQEHYFLTSPDVFVIDHLPQVPSWQLLERPITAEQYAKLAFVQASFWRLGFRLGNQSHVHISAQDRVSVSLGVTQPVRMSARLMDAATRQAIDGDYALVQVSATEARADAAFPQSGEYILRLFAEVRDSEKPLQWVMDYRITAQKGEQDSAFPSPFDAFTARQVTLVEPMTGILKAGHSYRFRLRVAGAISVQVITGGQWKKLVQNGEEWAGDVVTATGNSSVVAKFDKSTSFTSLLEYTVR
nr:transglutaminase domain-containing protein [uncultured Rhodoferax sp.]